MRVARHHWPVGQGLFTTGEINVAPLGYANPTQLRYVYDCGARRARAGSPLQTAITAYTEQVSKIDALFVSHFDEDHIAGLDRLLENATVDTVYLPYLDEETPILDVLDAIEKGQSSTSLIQAQLDPGRWFGERGARRVVLIRRGDTPPGGPAVPEPGAPPMDDLQPRFIESQKTVHVARREVNGRTCLVERVDLGCSVFVNWGRGLVDWVLIPYVFPAPEEAKSSFLSALRGVLDLGPAASIDASILVDALRTKKRRKQIKSCYDKVMPYGATRMHNRLSMSLYSGPASSPSPLTWRMGRHDRRPHFAVDDSNVGWLGTGDAALNVDTVRDDFRQFFKKVEPQIRSLVLPHHGSEASFDASLLDMPALKYCIACSDPADRGYEHPSRSVITAVLRAFKQLDHVSGDPTTAVTEVVWDRHVHPGVARW